MLDAPVRAILDRPHPLVLWLTGAGLSAESGIPTFRGREGYWRVGSRNYHPQELATRAAFQRMPEQVWSWYLYRRGVCRAAAPNTAHRALVRAEKRAGRRFLLVTQNIDGLHLRAGNSPERTFQIHGHIDFMRCFRECLPAPIPIPDGLDVPWEKGRLPTREEAKLLRCPSCSAWGRPHVLWFDERYDEPNFRFQSSVEAACRASLLIVIGTTGSTSLPMHIASIVTQRAAPMLVVNPEPNPFSAMVEERGNGAFVRGTASQWVPAFVDALPAG